MLFQFSGMKKCYENHMLHCTLRRESIPKAWNKLFYKEIIYNLCFRLSLPWATSAILVFIFSSSFCEDFWAQLLIWYSKDLLRYSIWLLMPVALTITNCCNINHKNHKHTSSHAPNDQNDKCDRYNALYDCDEWYFSTWRSSMSAALTAKFSE